MDQNQNTISWIAPEFRHYPKSVGWFVSLISIIILIVGFFIIQKDYYAALSLGIIGTFIFVFAKHKPKEINIVLSAKGIKMGNVFVPYKQIKYFWIVDNENHRTLNIETVTYLNHTLILELEDTDPEEVHSFLINFIPEHHETDETLAQKIMHKIKF